MIKLFNSILLLVFNFTIQAQTLISGKITSVEGQVIGTASVAINDSSTGNILAYALCNAKGEYKIEITSSLEQFVLQVRAFNYATEIRTIPNQSAVYNFTLSPKPTELPNVLVKPPPVYKRGDTLHYQVTEYADQKDRSIADVLRKMPGIEVQTDGRVLYQGKPIQKYYIEGMDLLEGKYNLANQNLPHVSVSSVQILENHQPIRILDSLVPTDRASLNIKLKSNITVTGSGRAGIGAAPILWDAGITPMLFKKGTQFIGSYQANNTGNDVGKQLTTLTLENLMAQMDNPTGASQTLQMIDAAAPPVSTQRYLDNNVHLLTGNLLTKLKKDLELRINTSYLIDAQQRIGDAITIYYTPQGDIALTETIQNRYFTNALNTQISLQQNTPKSYLKNMLTVNLHQNSGRGTVQNTLDTVGQHIATPMQQISNELRWITPIGKQLISLYSLVHYDAMPHQLSITPGAFPQILNNNVAYSSLQQQFTQRHLNTHHYAELTKGWRKWTVTPRMGLHTTAQHTKSTATIDKTQMPANAQNDIQAYYTKPYVKATLVYKIPKLDINIVMPLNTHFFTLSDAKRENATQNRFVTFDPNVYANYTLNGYWRFTLAGARQNSFSNFNQIFSGWVTDSYRSIRINNLPVAQSQAAIASVGAYFRNPIKSVFSHINYQWLRQKNPFLTTNLINPDGSRSFEFLAFENSISNHTLQIKGSKYLSKIKTTLSAGADLGHSQSNQVLDGQITRSTNRFIKPHTKVSTRFGTVAAFDYTLNYTLATNALQGNDPNRFNQLTQSLQIHLYPAKNHYLGLMAEHFYNKAFRQSTHNVYPDITYRYTLPKKRIDFQITLMNLLNEQQYLSAQFTDFFFYQSAFTIRPRQVLASVKFQL